MRGPRTIAAAQTVPRRGDVAGNVAAHVRLVHAAAGARVDVLVFPELSLTGYELDLAAELAFTEGDARLRPLVGAASATGMILVVGAPVRLGERLHIGALILSPDGSVEVATKQHLGAFSPDVNPGGPVPPPEPSVFQPGDRSPLVRFGAHTAAVGICADTGRPSHPSAAANRGATTYLASMFVPPGDVGADAARLGGYAVEHSIAVVMANYGGPTGGLAAGGRSSIWSQAGELLVQFESVGSGIAVAAESGTGWRANAVIVQ